MACSLAVGGGSVMVRSADGWGGCATDLVNMASRTDGLRPSSRAVLSRILSRTLGTLEDPRSSQPLPEAFQVVPAHRLGVHPGEYLFDLLVAPGDGDAVEQFAHRRHLFGCSG